MENIIMLILGVFISVVGIVNIKGNISTIHSYNRRKVKEEDIPKYGKTVGTGTVSYTHLYIINLQCLCMSKAMENLSIFICCCYSHDTFSFFCCIFFVNFLFVTAPKATVAALTVTNSEIPTLDSKWMSINECICYFLPGNLINSLNRCSCDLHRYCTLLLTVTFLVQKTNCFILIYRQNNGGFFLDVYKRQALIATIPPMIITMATTEINGITSETLST